MMKQLQSIMFFFEGKLNQEDSSNGIGVEFYMTSSDMEFRRESKNRML